MTSQDASNRTGEWRLYGHISSGHHDNGYQVWTQGDRWQVTSTGAPPTNDAGYGNLDALLALKNLKRSDLRPEEASAAPGMR